MDIKAKREEVDDAVATFDKGYIRRRAQKLKAYANMIRKLRFPDTAGETAELGSWSGQAAWSDDSGYILKVSHPALNVLAESLPKAFPRHGGGVQGQYKGKGWASRGENGEWVWEDSSFGIGD